MKTLPRRRAFALPELVALILIGVVLACVLIVMADGARRQGRIGDDLSKFRQIGAGTMSYAADFTDHRWGLSWVRGVSYENYPPQSTDYAAATYQVVHLLRTYGGSTIGPFSGFFPYFAMNHLPLPVYLGERLPSMLLVSSGDRHRLKWAADPEGYNMNLYSPNFGTGGINLRHPFGSSFQTPSAFFDSSPAGQRVQPSWSTDTMLVFPTGVLGTRQLTLVSHPSQKVHLADRIARFQGARNTYSTYVESRAPVLMVDGSAAVRAAADANIGANPNYPSATPPLMQYWPSLIDPPVLYQGQTVYGRYFWTREFLAGRDFGGPEIWP